jgi:ATP-dependent Clp protease ATP-binding subunit ClpA
VVDPEVSSFLKAQSFDPLYGARSVKRLLCDRLGTPVALAALAERGASGRHMHLAARLHESDVSVGRVTS